MMDSTALWALIVTFFTSLSYIFPKILNSKSHDRILCQGEEFTVHP